MFKGIHISIGSRIIKTSASAAIAVLAAESLSLDFSALAVTAAVMTLQPTLHETLDMAKRRLLGALIGSLLAIPFVYFFQINAAIEVFVGVMIILTLSNAFSLTTSSVLGIFAYVSIVTFPAATYVTMFDRFVNTLIGVMTSVIINVLFPVLSIAEKSESIMERALRHELMLLRDNLTLLIQPEKSEQGDLRSLTNEIIKELGEAFNAGSLLKREQHFPGPSNGYDKFDEKYHALWIIHNSVLQIQIDRDMFAKSGRVLPESAAKLTEAIVEFLHWTLGADEFLPRGTKNKIDMLIMGLEKALAAELDMDSESVSVLDEEISFYAVFLSNLKRFSENLKEFEKR